MPSRQASEVFEEEEWEEPARKRLRSSGSDSGFVERTNRESDGRDIYTSHFPESTKDKSIKFASTAKLAPQTVAPFLAKHIPDQYAPLGSYPSQARKDPNSKFCYRHRPDMLCRRQADELSMDELQKGLETLSQDDRQGIVQVWSLFSAAPSKHRNLMLQGILGQCCFPQLSYMSAKV